MNSRLPLVTLLAVLLVCPVALSELPFCASQDTPILGYPYDPNGGGGGAGQENEYSMRGSQFTLNGDATLTSMTAKMYVPYHPEHPNDPAHFRYAIYQDNNGTLGTLVAQTQEGSASTPNDASSNNRWITLDFDSPVSLHADTYWLMVAYQDLAGYNQEMGIKEPYKMAVCKIYSLDLPSEINPASVYVVDYMVVAVYASGQGVSSVEPPPSPSASHPATTYMVASAQNSKSSEGTVSILGNLTAYGSGVPSATVNLAYFTDTWQQYAQTVTSADGSFSADWIPPAPGSYSVNVTYSGAELYTPAAQFINVLVTSALGNQPQEVFSVDSNSTVTNLAFNSASSELRFSVVGANGTYGYADVTINKALVSDPSAIQATIDGGAASFTVSSTGDCWILHFSYHHSSHSIKFSLNDAQTTPNASVPELSEATLTLILGVLIVVLTVIAVGLVAAKRKRQ